MGYQKRRNFIVHSKFQFKFAINFIIAALIGCMISTALFNYFAVKKLEQIQWSIHLNAQSSGEVLKSIFMYVTLLGLVFVFLLLIITGFKMLKKINGPIYGIIKSLEEIKNGNLSKVIVIREYDEFNHVVDALNRMKDQVRDRFEKFGNRYGEISKIIKEIEKELMDGKPVDTRIKDLIILIKKLQKDIYIY